jgi:hypothetical protein
VLAAVLPRTPVSKLPVYAPNPSEWHHGWCHPIKEMRTCKEEKKEAPVSGDENKALLRRFFEASYQGDPETIEELHAPTSPITA